ncbi:peptidase B [Salmonella enterica subsp. enterica]|nr:peptidase B [Salmonella enterica subsp. enterica]
MTEAMKITLSTQPADARWGDKATYSINNDGITLHLNGKDDLGLIQRAARKIDGLGIKQVALTGEGWIPSVVGHSGRVTKDQKASVP